MKTDQVDFWEGDFGREYTDRNFFTREGWDAYYMKQYNVTKLSMNKDFIGNIFEAGEDMSSIRQIPQYKTLILRVGFDERKHGYLNPCQDILDEKYPSRRNDYNNDRYKPAPFYPTNPSDPNAAFCNEIYFFNLIH